MRAVTAEAQARTGAPQGAGPAGPRGVDRDAGELVIDLRRDVGGNPRVSATFVLERAPRPDERLGPLVERAVLTLGLEGRRGRDRADELVVSSVTCDLVHLLSGRWDGDREIVATATGSGPFPHVALDATVTDAVARALLESLLGNGDEFGLVLRAEVPAPPTPDVDVRFSLGGLWEALAAVSDESRRFYEVDLRNYVSQLLDTGVLTVGADGSAEPEDVLRAVLRAARWILVPEPELDPELGAVYVLSPSFPGNTDVVSSLANGPAGSATVEMRIGLRDLVLPAIAPDVERFVHLVAATRGRVEAILPARPARAARRPERSATHIAHAGGVRSVHSALRVRPSAELFASSPALAGPITAPQLVTADRLELVAADAVRRPGPVVASVDSPLFSDRFDNGRAWYVPELALVRPDPARPVDDSTLFRFEIEPTGGHDLAGNVGIEAVITLTLEARRSQATIQAWERAGSPPLDAIRVTSEQVRLAIPFRDENGVTRVERVLADRVRWTGSPGSVGGRMTATFRLLDRWARVAYGALSTEGFQAEPPTVMVDWAFEGWRAIRGTPVVAGLEKRWGLSRYVNGASRTAVAGGERASVVRPTAAATMVPALHDLPVATAAIQPAWQIRPDLVAELLRVRHEWSAFVSRQSIETVVSCATFGDAYREHAADGTWRAIGCRPALQLGQTEHRTYEEIELESTEKKARVYRSLRSPGRFLVVPEAYAIGRYEPDAADRAYRPAMLLHSTIDVDDPTNIRCVLAASLQPDVPPYRRHAILAELRRVAHPSPELEYLPDCGVPAEMTWALPANVDVDCIQTESGFDVVCSTDPAGFLVLRSMLERDGVRGAVVVQLPGGVRLSSSLLLGVASVVGPFHAGPISSESTDGGNLELTNRTGQRIAVTAVVSDEVVIAEPAEVLAPGATLTVNALQHEGPFQVTFAVEGGTESLDEVRAYIEDLELAVLFVSTADPESHGLAGLEIETRLEDAVDGDPLVLSSRRREAERSYVLPLTAFVEDPVLTFTVTAIAADGTRRTGTPVSWPVRSRGAVIPVGPPDG